MFQIKQNNLKKLQTKKSCVCPVGTTHAILLFSCELIFFREKLPSFIIQ